MTAANAPRSSIPLPIRATAKLKLTPMMMAKHSSQRRSHLFRVEGLKRKSCVASGVTVHGPPMSSFAPRKLRYFRGAKGDDSGPIPGEPTAARERLPSGRTVDSGNSYHIIYVMCLQYSLLWG